VIAFFIRSAIDRFVEMTMLRPFASPFLCKLILRGAAPRTGAGENAATTAVSEVPKRCRQNNSDNDNKSSLPQAKFLKRKIQLDS
jgi:hypothetical protein